jgi:hypothetical protein
LRDVLSMPLSSLVNVVAVDGCNNEVSSSILPFPPTPFSLVRQHFLQISFKVLPVFFVGFTWCRARDIAILVDIV